MNVGADWEIASMSWDKRNKLYYSGCESDFFMVLLHNDI